MTSNATIQFEREIIVHKKNKNKQTQIRATPITQRSDNIIQSMIKRTCGTEYGPALSMESTRMLFH